MQTCAGRCETNKACVQCKVHGTGELTPEQCAANCTHVVEVDSVEGKGHCLSNEILYYGVERQDLKKWFNILVYLSQMQKLITRSFVASKTKTIVSFSSLMSTIKKPFWHRKQKVKQILNACFQQC